MEIGKTIIYNTVESSSIRKRNKKIVENSFSLKTSIFTFPFYSFNGHEEEEPRMMLSQLVVGPFCILNFYICM